MTYRNVWLIARVFPECRYIEFYRDYEGRSEVWLVDVKEEPRLWSDELTRQETRCRVGFLGTDFNPVATEYFEFERITND